MLDITDLLEYAQDDCDFDLYDCDLGANIAENLSREELEDWCKKHSYDLLSFEPSQRENTFAIVFNINNVEEKENE